MPPRNVGRLTFPKWNGLNTFIEKTNIEPASWFDANNVLVNAKGEAEVLRSPKTFGSTVGSSGTLTGMSEYERVAGHALFIDRGTATYYLLAAAGSPTSIRTGQSGNAWTSLTANNRFFRIDGTEFVQFLPDLTSKYRNGIDPPAAAPTIAYVDSDSPADASDSSEVDIAASLQGSYAYMNSTTGHVSPPSPLSNVLGPKNGGETDFAVSFTVVASAQTGVDKLVFFLTEDGGNIPYLVIDCDTGAVTTKSNTSTTIDLIFSAIDRDTLTPEPIYNYPPQVTGSFMFLWKDRIMLVVNGGIQYSGFESCYIGQPQESWPILNQLNIPNKADQVIGGLSMQVGALIFGRQDSYLITGYPSDKTSSPNNTIAVTEHIEPLNWRIGITYPQTAVNTPFGAIWVDQTSRIRNWNMTGIPIEIAQPLRTELDAMTGAMKAKWYQHGKNGGFYIVTDGTTTLFIMLYLAADTGQLQFGYGKSTTLTPDAISACTFATERFFYAKTNQVYEILDPSLQGGGWAAGTPIFFDVMLGNDGNFSGLHSMQVEGGMNELTVTVSAADGTELEEIILEEDLDTGGAFYGVIDSPVRRRHIMAFTYGIDDTEYRNVKGMQIFLQNKQRIV